MSLCKGSLQREKRRGPKSQPRGRRSDTTGSGSLAAREAGSFQNQEQRMLREGAELTHWKTVSTEVRRAPNGVHWIWPQDREVTADHKMSSFCASGAWGLGQAGANGRVGVGTGSC